MCKFIDKKSVSIIREFPIIDDWFVFNYSCDLYKGCPGKCIYCLGAISNSGEIIRKSNALELITKEINKIPSGSLTGVGGGLNDIYLVSDKYPDITKNIYKIFKKKSVYPFILTKSSLIRNDIPELKQFKKPNRTIICTSISSCDNNSSDFLEEGLPTATERFKLLSHINSNGLKTGLCYMPLIPFYNDSDMELKLVVSEAKRTGCSFILFNILKLENPILTHFFDQFRKKDKIIADKLEELYCSSDSEKKLKIYTENKEREFTDLCREYQILPRIPLELYKDTLSLKDQISIVLGHIYYLQLCMDKKREGFKFASYSLKKITNEKFNQHLEASQLQMIPGVGRFIEECIINMVFNSDYSYYEKIVAAFFKISD